MQKMCCLLPHRCVGTNLMKPLRQEKQEPHSQAHLLELQPPSQCTKASTGREGVTASCLQEPKCLQPTSLLAPFLLYLLSPSHCCPSFLSLSGPLSPLFSIFLLSEESFSFSLSAAATFSTNCPSFSHPFALQLPGRPPATSLPVPSYRNHCKKNLFPGLIQTDHLLPILQLFFFPDTGKLFP